ncbi:MAG: glycosyl hydrolase family 28-related protein [Caldilineaceae bacterium]
MCVTDFDTINNRPTIKRATRNNLATSKTVFGIAENNAVFEDDVVGGSVFVLVAGEVMENAITSLGAGKSNIIATDIHNAPEANQCRLKRIERPDGSEYVVGTCDENGNLVVQPRASRETSTLHGFNVKSYGALGNGAVDDSLAITNAVSAIAASGGSLFFPSGTYSITSDLTIPPHVHVTFEEGAMLAPAGAAVTIQGIVTCHPAQRVFSGTGVNKNFMQVGPGPAATVSGSPFGNYSVVVTVHTPGGLPAPLGTATFTYTLNGSFDSFPKLVTAASVVLPLTGLTIAFGASPPDFEEGTTYTWTSQAPITLGSAAFDRFNVRNFGAVPDYDPDLLAPLPTDNLPFFHAALAAMAASGNRSAKLVVDGHFYLSDTLALTQTIVLEGTAMNEPPPFAPSRSRPGTMLVFPGNTDGIRVHSAALEDSPTAGAEKTILRNLIIFCKDAIDPDHNNTGNGLSTRTQIYVENVTIKNFAQDGINVHGNIVGDLEGNASNCNFINCVVGGCGRDGFHLEGGDATGCTLLTCSAVVNRRYGFFDSTRGNTYITCHAEANGAKGLQPPIGGDGVPAEDGGRGAEWRTEGATNSSCLVSCYAEGPHRNELLGQVMILGGAIGESNLTETSTCFVLEKGVASRSPYKYNNDRNGAGNRIVACLGSENGDAPDALSFGTPDAPNTDYNVLRYDSTKHWWELQNSSQHRRPIAFPTIQCGSRQAAPQFRHGIFLGGDAGAVADVSFIAAPTLPATQYSSDNAPLTYERGDVVWNSEPSPGGQLGWVCVQAGMQDQLRFATTGDVLAFDTALTLTNPTSFAVNQFITIAGVTGIRQIVALAGSVATLNTAGDNAANIVDGAVAVKMIGTIPNGSADLVVDDISRLIIGQYIAIAGVTGGQKIVSLGAPAALECATAETYDFDDGFTLVVQIDNGPVQTVTFHTADFADIHAALASEVAMLLDAALTHSGATATSGGTKVTITSDTKGVSSHVQVTGGTANTALGFSPIVVDGTANPVTIETPNGGAAATDAIIEFWSATFSTFGVVDSPSKSYAGNTPLTLADRYVTVTAVGTKMTLPASPVDGQTHSIRSQAGLTTMVNTADGVLIDGALPPATVGPLENRNFRYSTASGEWEIR